MVSANVRNTGLTAGAEVAQLVSFQQTAHISTFRSPNQKPISPPDISEATPSRTCYPTRRLRSILNWSVMISFTNSSARRISAYGMSQCNRGEYLVVASHST